jgi:hypothetical protein
MRGWGGIPSLEGQCSPERLFSNIFVQYSELYKYEYIRFINRIAIELLPREKEGYDRLKGQCHNIFCFRFFHESSAPKPLEITLGSFRFLSNIRGDIPSQGYHRCQLNRWPICHWYQQHPRSIFPSVRLVSLIPVANCHRNQRHRWQIFHQCPFLIMATISDYLRIKENLKEKSLC